MLDENAPDHIGWLLWQATQDWHRRFVAGMQAAGHGWFTEARSTLLGAIASRGTSQSRLVERLAISKQAVQQLIDGLEGEGILERLPDPEDGRGRIVRLTEKGRLAMRDAARVKDAIGADYAGKLGAADFATLSGLLVKLQKS